MEFPQLGKEDDRASPPPQPGITINGDQVEYLTDGKEAVAIGNVEILYKNMKLTCDKISVNTQTKDGVAEGHVRIEDKNGVIEGEKITYNFQSGSGNLIDAKFRSTPFFGIGRKLRKLGDGEFISRKGYFTTCDLDIPHYRLKTAKVEFFPGNQVKATDVTVFAKKVPVAYLPQFVKSFKDPMAHVQLTPGKTKDWGAYMLSAWRYSITEKVTGRIYFDYRQNLGTAEGFGANYKTINFGKGDFKYYYTQERLRRFVIGDPRIFQRYLIRLRHQWDIDERTDMIGEYYKIIDSKMSVLGSNYSILKDYFPREYEKSIQPPTYVQVHHMFNYASLDLFIQKRTNRWYAPGYLERLPEVKFSLPSIQMAESPLYFEDSSSTGNYNLKNTSTSTPAANDTNPDRHFNRVDTYNKVSLPMKAAFVQLTPFVADRTTLYSEGAQGDSVGPRTIFYSGADASTKFYRVFNLNTNLLGLDINGLRHVITPTLGYNFNHEPTIPRSKLKQIDGIDSIVRNNSMSLGIENKLQTKRKGSSVDLAYLRVTTSYVFKPKTGEKRGSSFSDILVDLELIPYSWMRVDTEATYDHSGTRDSENYGTISNANFDLRFTFSEERSFGFGQRYDRKGGNSITYDLKWRINPKWKFSFYHRIERGHDYTLKRGLKEQQYSIIRDLHCWEIEGHYDVKRGNGNAVWLIFRLKAFPEIEFDYNREYNQPKPGSQSPGEPR